MRPSNSRHKPPDRRVRRRPTERILGHRLLLSSVVSSATEVATHRPRAAAGSEAPFWGGVAAFVGFGLLLRLLLVLAIPTQPVSDFWEYFQRAENLMRSGPPQAIPGVTDAGHP